MICNKYLHIIRKPEESAERERIGLGRIIAGNDMAYYLDAECENVLFIRVKKASELFLEGCTLVIESICDRVLNSRNSGK